MIENYKDFGFEADSVVYFRWLCEKIKGAYYSELLWRLFVTPFRDVGKLDSSRIYDGLQLRCEFERATGGHYTCGRTGECSFLELFIGLALRFENYVMAEARYGDRTVDWFWLFIDNLGLSQATDGNWSYSWEKEVKRVLKRVMYREYESDGSGGMFIVKGRSEDMRQVDIWRQLMWYASEEIRAGKID